MKASKGTSASGRVAVAALKRKSATIPSHETMYTNCQELTSRTEASGGLIDHLVGASTVLNAFRNAALGQ
jgi:hypothetical protein